MEVATWSESKREEPVCISPGDGLRTGPVYVRRDKAFVMDAGKDKQILVGKANRAFNEALYDAWLRS